MLWSLGGLFAIFGALVCLAGALISRFDTISLEDGIYFAFVTALTIGFGDITPTTRASRVLTVLLALLGVFFTGIAVAIAVHALSIALKAGAI